MKIFKKLCLVFLIGNNTLLYCMENFETETEFVRRTHQLPFSQQKSHPLCNEFIPLMSAEFPSTKIYTDEEIINKQTLWEYQRLADSFRNLDFLVGYDRTYNCYKVIIYPNDNPIVYWFSDYKKFIFGAYEQAYNNMRNKKNQTTISDKSSDCIYAHIRWLETWPTDSLYTTEDLLHKQKVWQAFKNEDMNTLSMLLERKNVSKDLINFPYH